MIQESKKLLIQNLCAMLPYGVMCQVDVGCAGLDDGKLEEIDIPEERVRFADDGYWDADIEDVKPYLRPMSSMTEEEKKEYHKLCDNYYDVYFDSVASLDWLNAHHFDYRGLIEKGLAIEVNESNNPYKL
jgi:hypothetical protein